MTGGQLWNVVNELCRRCGCFKMEWLRANPVDGELFHYPEDWFKPRKGGK